MLVIRDRHPRSQHLTTTLPNLTAALVVTLCITALQQVHCQEEPSASVSGVQDIDLSGWQKAENENRKLLVLFYQLESCEKCALALDSLNKIVGQPEIPSGLEIVKSSSPDLVAHLGIKQIPSLVYLKEQSYRTYDGNFDVEDLLEWVQLATNAVTHKLNDESFEHLTQASTGATTGDWLVAFYDEKCKSVLPQLDTLSVRVSGRINVAKVSITESPDLVKRFKITECPVIMLFKQGKMYKFTLPAMDAASLRSFVDVFYKNVQAQPVPLQKSNFDLLTENLADYIKVQLEGENRTIILASLFAVAVSFLVIIFFCCRSVFSGQRRKMD